MRERVLTVKNGEKTIYGMLYLPNEEKDRYPVVIMSHGFNGTHTAAAPHVVSITGAGYALYAFDFCGGGLESKSDGEMTSMTVLTEASDLNAVVDAIGALDEIDKGRMLLFGESQGGFVSSYVAAGRAAEIKGLLLFFPAFVLQDDARRTFPEGSPIPETYEVMGIRIGRVFAKTATSFDIYDVIGKYEGEVLIIHGDADKIVPIRYSERAVGVYANATLKVIPGADHGFVGEELEAADKMAVEFIRRILG